MEMQLVLSAATMELLKLIALDDEDLKVLSVQLQDAILRVEDMAFLPQERRFAAVLNRFDWLSATGDGQETGSGFERRRCALRFERVLGAQFQNLALADKTAALELLAVNFEAEDLPSGAITLIFCGGGAIRLQVEFIEAELRDLGPVWKTRVKPEHPDGGAEASSEV
jgi:Protein of unknown function (DUF2948)